MTALDRAFIRAYAQPAAGPVPAAQVDPAEWPAGIHYVPAEAIEAAPPGPPSPAADAGEPAHEPTGADVLAGPWKVDFHPAFQVEHFAWSASVVRLSHSAGLQLDRLADGLSAGLAEGRKVVALCGGRRGEGCTTLLLCAARRLAERGLRVALVDADFDNPLLGRRLGLLPETGLEDVLAGRLPLAEAAIESTIDRLTVLPLRSPLKAEDFPPQRPAEPARALAELREHYDMVLVDVGEFRLPAAEASGWGIDAAVLIHNRRSTPTAKLAGARKRLAEAGWPEAGVVENFV